jgi:hypothetical protein
VPFYLAHQGVLVLGHEEKNQLDVPTFGLFYSQLMRNKGGKG